MTLYNNRHLIPGKKADARSLEHIETLLTGANNIPFGTPVFYSADYLTALLAAPGNLLFAGIALEAQSQAHGVDADNYITHYVEKDALANGQNGAWTVLMSEDVVKNEPVRIDTTTNLFCTTAEAGVTLLLTGEIRYLDDSQDVNLVQSATTVKTGVIELGDPKGITVVLDT